MEEKLVETVLLENNLTLNFYDASKKIAEGRYYVALIIRMDVYVKPEIFTDNGADAATYDEIVGAVGDMIVFEKKRERNFISATDKDAVFKEMCDSVLTHTSLYYSRENFPKKFILSEYKKIADYSTTSR
jgi:hypothetical protein